MSNEIKAPRLLGNYGGHTFDGHLTLAIMKTCEEDKNLITDSNFQNCRYFLWGTVNNDTKNKNSKMGQPETVSDFRGSSRTYLRQMHICGRSAVQIAFRFHLPVSYACFFLYQRYVLKTCR